MVSEILGYRIHGNFRGLPIFVVLRKDQAVFKLSHGNKVRSV